MKYYTLFLGNRLWTDVIDDMNSQKDWATGGMLWTSKKKALSCMANLQTYDFEKGSKRFRIVEVTLK